MFGPFKRANRKSAHFDWRARMPLIASVAAGLVMGAITGAWSIHAIGKWAFSGIAMDAGLGAYICSLLILLQKRLGRGIALSTICAFALYLAAIAKYEVMNTEASVVDLLLLDDLFINLSANGGWVPYVVLGVMIALALAYLRNIRLPAKHELVLFIPCALYLAAIVLAMYPPQAMAAQMQRATTGYTWFPLAVVRGHWGSFLRSGLSFAARHQELVRLESVASPYMGFIGSDLGKANQRNIHIIVLESFIDPLSIPGAQITPDPFAPMFQEWRRSSGLRSVQPVFGGRSPDGEFEILCGLPVTLDDGAVIFSQLKLPSVDCLPRKLQSLGWKTESWVPVSPAEFSYDQAYERIGIENRRFNGNMDMSDLDGVTLSAGSLLQQNLDHVRTMLKAQEHYLNYIFVTAGHFPYEVDRKKRPYQVSVDPDSKLLMGYINCSYYTSHAVEGYITSLREIDPDAIIVVLGDHPPGLPGLPSQITYPRPVATRFDVPLLIFNGREGAIDLKGRVPGYYIPGIIADLLTDGEFCRRNRCLHREPVAVRPLAHALLAIDRASDRVVDCAAESQTDVCRRAELFSEGAKLGLYRLVGME